MINHILLKSMNKKDDNVDTESYKRDKILEIEFINIDVIESDPINLRRDKKYCEFNIEFDQIAYKNIYTS